MLSIVELNDYPIYAKECDPDYWVVCGPDVGGNECAPEYNDCAPDYGEDGCMPDCSPSEP